MYNPIVGYPFMPNTKSTLIESRELDLERYIEGRKRRLITACQEGNIKEVTKTIKGGLFECRLTTNFLFDSRVPICEAAKNGNIEIVKKLIEGGAIVDKEDDNGDTALLQGVLQNHLNVVELLLTKKASNALHKRNSTILHYCPNIHNLEILLVLVKKFSPQINAVDLQGKTPLHLAVECGNVKAVAVFLNHGADPSIEDKQGNNPLDIIILKRNIPLKDRNAIRVHIINKLQSISDLLMFRLRQLQVLGSTKGEYVFPQVSQRMMFQFARTKPAREFIDNVIYRSFKSETIRNIAASKQTKVAVKSLSNKS